MSTESRVIEEGDEIDRSAINGTHRAHIEWLYCLSLRTL